MKALERAMKKDVDTDQQRGCTSQSGDTEMPVVVIDIETNLKIQGVPPMLRGVEENKKCYDPLVVSIGPFHHLKELHITEEHKIAIARQYAENGGQSYDLLYNKVKAIAGDARNCFSLNSSAEVELVEEKFTKMMFLDGCFILQFIRCFVNDLKDLKMKLYLAAFVKRDLFLLENQLPFLVLRELMSKNKEEEWKKMLSTFFNGVLVHPSDSPREIDFDQCAHLLDMIHTLLIDKVALSAPQHSKIDSDLFSCRSAKELKAAGIYFRPSQGHRFTDVQLRSMFKLIRFLELPPIIVDDSTKSILLNMVAYEACPDAPEDLWVSSYICFLDSLIDHAEDVKELRSKGILRNFLGSDQQVADLFNQIADNLVANPNAYAEVKNRLERHYKNKIKIWLAEWLHTHFTSPWTVLAFVGAIFALVLSVIQTYESVYATETAPCPCAAANHTI
ncbi:hypothetical protein LWI28_006478 [Acer negundo]|uniref:Uncharacterized protein n=1 Tax=Acer negundo TaxID=4023 RepID=A0AAD5NIR3_ACENE|nr:hypothetical protein LWI28_006478 [Acer negundo]KAK4840084.1 hypothetical protein QYF36_027260 [Acer negundo]